MTEFIFLKNKVSISLSLETLKTAAKVSPNGIDFDWILLPMYIEGHTLRTSTLVKATMDKTAGTCPAKPWRRRKPARRPLGERLRDVATTCPS
jgi:hypothetical protein